MMFSSAATLLASRELLCRPLGVGAFFQLDVECRSARETAKQHRPCIHRTRLAQLVDPWAWGAAGISHAKFRAILYLASLHSAKQTWRPRNELRGVRPTRYNIGRPGGKRTAVQSGAQQSKAPSSKL